MGYWVHGVYMFRSLRLVQEWERRAFVQISEIHFVFTIMYSLLQALFSKFLVRSSDEALVAVGLIPQMLSIPDDRVREIFVSFSNNLVENCHIANRLNWCFLTICLTRILNPF